MKHINRKNATPCAAWHVAPGGKCLNCGAQEDYAAHRRSQGHRPNGDPVQIHSAGPLYPGVLYALEFEGDPHTYHGVLFEGFDYGVFRSYDNAVELVYHIKAVRAVDYYPGQRVVFERQLAVHMDKRAARAGITPLRGAFEGGMCTTLSTRERDLMPVDSLRTPLVIRMRYGHTPQADRWLEAWGYNPLDFQAH